MEGEDIIAADVVLLLLLLRVVSHAANTPLIPIYGAYKVSEGVPRVYARCASKRCCCSEGKRERESGEGKRKQQLQTHSAHTHTPHRTHTQTHTHKLYIYIYMYKYIEVYV